MFDALFGRNKSNAALSLEVQTLNNKHAKLNRIVERMNLRIADAQDRRDYETLCAELGIEPKREVYVVDNPYFATR